MSGNEIPSAPSRKKIEDSIGNAETMNSSKTKQFRAIINAETVAAGAEAAGELMECMMDISLNRVSGNQNKSVST